MSQKLVALKPVVMSANGYTGPCGANASKKSFVGRYGYGAEEWNGNSRRISDGWRIFHTQAKGRLLDYGKLGNLAILMLAYKNKNHYLVGAGVNVFANSDEEMNTFAEKFEKGDTDELWQVPSVRSKFPSEEAFLDHRKHARNYLQWRVHPRNYLILPNPKKIDAKRIFGKSKLVVLHSNFEIITPEQALQVLDDVVDSSSAIRSWLKKGDFVPPRKKRTPKAVKNSAAPPSCLLQRYIKEQELIISPAHAALQSQFSNYIDGHVDENVNFVDIRYKIGKRTVLGEVKPCDLATCRFAIRTAMGQLLDYQQKENSDCLLLIILSVKPKACEIALAHQNGFGVAYPSNQKFEVVWPKLGN